MKVISVLAVCLALALPLFARPRAAKETGKAPMTDQEFVNFAAQTDMTEANLGQVAQQKGGQAVQDYGAALRSDHTSDYAQLTAAAQKAGLNVPQGIDAKNDRMINSFNKLKGPAFDHSFAREMIEGHEHAVAVYKKESEDAQSPDVKAYAQQALSTLQKHLGDAKQLEKPKG